MVKVRFQWRFESWWIVVLAAATLLAIAMGTRSSFGLFVGPINTTTALGAAAVSFAFALYQLGWGAGQPICGVLERRVGTAPVIAAGCVLTALGLGSITLFGSSSALAGALALTGAAGAAAGGTSLILGAVAQRVPQSHRGLALGIVSAGSSVGQLVLAMVGAALMADLGWQGAMLTFAALALAAVPLSRVFRRPASDAAPTAAGAPPEVAPSWSARAALREPSFWYVSGGFFVCGFHVTFLTSHMPGVIELCGLPPSFSGLWLAIVGACNIVGSLGAGWLMQRMPMKSLLGALYALRAAGIALFLVLPASESMLLGFALWMGFTYMATLPPTTGLIAKLYGVRNVAVLFGVASALHQVGSFLGAWVGGIEHELTGGYRWTWLIDMLLACAAALLHVPIRESAETSASGVLAAARPATVTAR